tara:strand:+ start:13222 stop:15792 length:2571 start_codon:yes stop_codon:yes gene_type:complete
MTKSRSTADVVYEEDSSLQNVQNDHLTAEQVINNLAAELVIAAAELVVTNKQLSFQNNEKEKRAAELVIANSELKFQNGEKEKRAAELVVANTELSFQSGEKEKRAAELAIANTELNFQNSEKEKRAAELVIANTELNFQNSEKEKRAAELAIANTALNIQNSEKEKRAAELVIANTELSFQNNEKEKRAAELVTANTELSFQNNEKEKRAAELVIANSELSFQNSEKEKRAAELAIANIELSFQNNEKEKRAAELAIANTELSFQNNEKEKRAAELVIANKELRIAATVFESQEGMIVTDASNIILRVNRAFTTITGFSAEEVIGQPPRTLNSGTQSKAFFATVWDNINNTGKWKGEILARRKNGDIYPEHIHITAVKNAKEIVTNYVTTFTDITSSKAASDEIERLAFYDSLTQLPNRRLFLDRLNRGLAFSAHSRHRGALLFLDLDQFKNLNDTLGHDIGDLLLQQVTARLNACLRESDTVARFGGDEFVVLLENLSIDAIEAAAQTKYIATKISHTLNQPYQLSGHVCHNTTSIGATFFIGHEVMAEELIKQADIAMYQSKAKGGNTLRFFDQMMQKAIIARVELENELREAIEQQQFQLHYQLQVDYTGQPLGAEVLIRWQHPQRGIIPPLHFIPLSEDIGLILPIGQWVLDTVCAQLKIWQQDPLTSDIVLAVNVSAKQLHQANFVEQVLATLQRHGTNPARLKLELTESMLVDNINDIIAKMNVLNKIGIRFSLDDFGTGYSSLQYLKMLPLEQLKIDRSFVQDIATNTSDRTIVHTIITMASSLGINVIAEGVETTEQRRLLWDNGCLQYQGYLFSKPVSLKEFEAILKTNSQGVNKVDIKVDITEKK